jgi:hypothetical protein
MNSLFIKSFVKSIYNYIMTRFFKKSLVQGKKVVGKVMMNSIQTNAFVHESILSGKPFMVGRYGGCENDILASYYINKKTRLPVSDLKFNYLCSNAGFFPKDINLLNEYVRVMEEAGKEVDVLGAWNWFMEDFIIGAFAKNAKITTLGNLEPWFSDIPWSSALIGKKVLVVHPFQNSIEAQYKKRALLFPNTNILPEFELKTLKAVQSIAGNKPEGFSTWFEALDYMTEEIRKIDFDIAIIGCGAYGFPLAARVKKMNKQAIHLAGATQLFFGIKGSRWEQGNYKPIFEKIFNEHWIRPLEIEKPKKAEAIEGACYW